MKTQNTLNNWVINEMIEKLNDMKGYDETVYPCDLGYKLFESENMNESYYCSAFKAKQWIKKYYDDFGDAVDDYENNFGDSIGYSPFNDPERFMVVIILEKSNELIGQCDSLSDIWDNETVFTSRIINKVIKDLKGLKE